MTQREKVEAAWKLLLTGAESALEDWYDEDGQYSEEDAEEVRALAGTMLRGLRGGVKVSE